jgi:hypothetical protein
MAPSQLLHTKAHRRAVSSHCRAASAPASGDSAASLQKRCAYAYVTLLTK